MSKYCSGTFAQSARMGVAQEMCGTWLWIGLRLLTISKLKRWSINYYVDTAQTAGRAGSDLQRANGGLGDYYSEHETRTPQWLCAGDARTTAGLVGLTDTQRAGGEAHAGVVTRWLDDGVAPNGACGRAFGERGVHGFDLTFSAPKSVSVIRALKVDDVVAKGIADAHSTALAEAMEYLAAHAGYTRVHNPITEEKDLVRLPGLVAVAYQHETSRCGDPHLHTHVIVPNRQARADGVLVSWCPGVHRRDVALSRSQGGRGDLPGHLAPGTAPVVGVRVDAGRTGHGDGGAGGGGPRIDHRVVAAVLAVARVGGAQSTRRR